MTATTADLDEIDAEAPESTPAPVEDGDDDKDNRDRDFSKVRDLHTELADYINGNEHFKAAGLDNVSAGQIKAVLYLRTDYNNSPERVAAREAKRVAKEAEKAKYAGLSDDQVKKVKAADRAKSQADKLAERAKKAQEDAARLIAEANSGEDIAAQVESTQNGVQSPSDSAAEAPKSRPGIKRGGAK